MSDPVLRHKCTTVDVTKAFSQRDLQARLLTIKAYNQRVMTHESAALGTEWLKETRSVEFVCLFLFICINAIIIKLLVCRVAFFML